MESGVEGLEEKELATVIHRIGDDLGGWLQVSNNTFFFKSLNFIERKALRNSESCQIIGHLNKNKITRMVLIDSSIGLGFLNPMLLPFPS